ncbi:MAG TPA: hypothetical protein VHU81_12745 [Thermoanaerobaculia bacterium]|jgi:hypothetical protein|nr:hypothetical protein [Thermoanaerobaculia bacterium]
MRKTLSLVTLALGILLALPPMAQAEHWTAVGSTGTVDESASGFYGFGATSAGYRAGSTALTSAVFRYNVTNTSGQEIAPWNEFELGYFDNGATGQVLAQFFQVNPCTGARTLICSITSQDSPTANCARCTFGTAIDFSKFLYYVEVTVSRSNSAALPTANTLRIF